MKKIILSAMTAFAVSSVSASEIKLYTDENGQVFTKPAEGRTLLKTPTPVFSKASKLKFSGNTFLNYTYETSDDSNEKSLSEFDVKKAYLQVKAYILDDPKSYYRITLDLHDDNGSKDMRLKYGYLYLNEILPFTGVELGLVHRPWHDYEQHSAWGYRSIQKVFLEDSNSANLSSSADFGINFKTNTELFDTEIGLFNGEGYHKSQEETATDTAGMSFEWRATAHLLGKRGKPAKTTYAEASFFGQLNENHKTSADGISGHLDDLHFYGFHAVYNQPSFLVAAQYILSADTASNSTYVSTQAGDGYSVNGEYRLGSNKEYRVFGRFDSWTPKKLKSSDEREQQTMTVGASWKQNKNVAWTAGIITQNNEYKGTETDNDKTDYTITANIKF